MEAILDSHKNLSGDRAWWLMPLVPAETEEGQADMCDELHFYYYLISNLLSTLNMKIKWEFFSTYFS